MHKTKLNFCHAHRVNRFDEQAENWYNHVATVQISYNLNALCILRVPKNAFKCTIKAANAYERNICS